MRVTGSRIALLLMTTASAALGETESIRLVYVAPSGTCPPRVDFEAEIRARTAKVAFGDSGRRFDILIEQGEVGFVGTLGIHEEGATGSERHIDGSDCGELASALALVAALAVDPDAKTAARAELEILPMAEPELPRPVTAAALPNSKARPTAVPEPAPRREAPRNASWGWSVGLAASALVGPAPKWLFAVGPEAELRRESGTSLQSVGLSLYGAQTGTLGPSDERARFRLIAARALLCPLGADKPWRWRACGVVDAGALAAEGQAIEKQRSASRAWLAAGATGRLGTRLSSRIYVELVVSGLLNATRDRFVFLTPRRTVYEVPVASFAGGVSAGLSWP